ncbi:histone-lysine N-methyltransferase, H3 lysine-79 specific-like [Chanodichthys erythropterus]|uniref:histone-lysine N-methyltransferase, H3 lysine-79 specific-like n=1 Tax=Chanodichthys erythropterus TaxID=933992 RepID=UPI00351F343E
MLQLIKRWLYYDECKRREESRSETDLMVGEMSDSSEQMDTDEETANWEAAKPRIKEQPAQSNQKSKTSTNQKPKTSKQKIDQHSSDPKHSQTESVSQSAPQSEQTCNISGMSKERKETFYIRIPLSDMSGTESTSKKYEKCPESYSSYKLLDKYPSENEMKNEIRKRKSYIMSYDKETKSPEWVYEILNKNTLKRNCKKNMSFGDKDFKWEGYDQGHLAAAANHMWCQEAYHDTFLLSNMTPQISDLNKGNWCKLEQYCRDIVKDDNVRNVHVYTGPLYWGSMDSYVRSLGNKVVPTHFFKVVIVEENNGTVREPECYRMPNEKSENKTEEVQVKKEGQKYNNNKYKQKYNNNNNNKYKQKYKYKNNKYKQKYNNNKYKQKYNNNNNNKHKQKYK